MLNETGAYEDIFVALINDWAWLCTKTDYLSTFPVTITFLG